MQFLVRFNMQEINTTRTNKSFLAILSPMNAVGEAVVLAMRVAEIILNKQLWKTGEELSRASALGGGLAILYSKCYHIEEC
jgi:hypothetical protein